jgi:peptidoglycan/LPS O-acetylase OafA/YrhL
VRGLRQILSRLSEVLFELRGSDGRRARRGRGDGAIVNGSQPDFSCRIPQLDGLRGLAIALVLAFHYLGFANQHGAPWIFRPLFWVFSLGWSGVDMFFVLSGFLIGGILLDARESRNFFSVFYRRRAYRILPLYFAFLAIAAIAAQFSRWPLLHGEIPWQAEIVFFQNIWLSAHKSLLNDPTWSLAVEEQFYLILPAVIYFVKPSRLPSLLAAGIVLAPAIRLAIYAVDPQLTTAIYVLLPCRMNSLLFGVAAAYFLRQPDSWNFLRARRRQLWMLLEVLTVGCFAFLIHPNVTAPLEMFLGFDCFALLYTLLLLASLVDEKLAKALQAKWLMGLGGIAYCVYLIQYPVFAITAYALRRHADSGLLAALIALPLTIAIAKISWKYFEKPFVHLGHRSSYSARRESESPRIAPIAAAEAQS